MQFIVYLADKQKHLMTEELLYAHVDYLKQLKKEKKLLYCGVAKNDTAIMILSCQSIYEAQQIINEDPFTSVGYYASREIVEFEEANEGNNFLLDK